MEIEKVNEEYDEANYNVEVRDKNEKWIYITSEFSVSSAITVAMNIHIALGQRARVGTVDFLVPNLYFPTTSNQVAGGINFNNVSEAKKYVEEMFFDFRSHINL